MASFRVCTCPLFVVDPVAGDGPPPVRAGAPSDRDGFLSHLPHVQAHGVGRSCKQRLKVVIGNMVFMLRCVVIEKTLVSTLYMKTRF